MLCDKAGTVRYRMASAEVLYSISESLVDEDEFQGKPALEPAQSEKLTREAGYENGNILMSDVQQSQPENLSEETIPS